VCEACECCQGHDNRSDTGQIRPHARPPADLGAAPGAEAWRHGACAEVQATYSMHACVMWAFESLGVSIIAWQCASRNL
jgi:hypothetical protein